MGITVKIAGKDRTGYVDARSLHILDELTSRVNSASFVFICNDIALAPIDGQAVLIEEGTTKLFSGRVLIKEEDFLPPNLLKYQVECIDNTRDLDKKLVIESYLDQKAGDIIKDVITKYTSGFTTVHISDGPTITRIAFDYIQVSEAITRIAETCGYEWYINYDKDIYFFLKTDYPASFQLDDDQEYYKDLIINTDVSQLRNRIYVKSSKYETLDFTELFIGDGSTVTWTCKYQANALPHPSLKSNGAPKTVGWFGDPPGKDFYLNAVTKVLSLGVEDTPADGDEIVITYGADIAIIIRWDDKDSIEAVKAIEGGDGIFEHCITDNNIDTKEWAIDRAKADLLQNANPVIEGTFITNQSDIRSGQIITLNSTKRNINQDFLIQKVELVSVDVVTEYPKISYKPAATAIIGYKPAADAEIPYRAVEGSEVIYYVYQITIATKLRGLEDLLLQLLYQSSESLKRDTEAPEMPSGLALSTGMGEITQAGLAWLKATWEANIEDDFSHYELKYKKTAYSDYGYVTTTNTSFIWTGLEQNIEYEVYIRSVDIYGNRSAWSSQKTQTTATDTEVPAQITGAVATALLAGMKVVWTKSSDKNIAGYVVERQESDNGTTWTGEWTERVRITATMWLDLLLPYTKYYRYQIKAFTQTGTEGATSTPTTDSIKPNKAGTNDIVAEAITADLIAANSITANKYNELRNTYVFNGEDSLDPDHPFELDFEIVPEMTAIQSVKLSFRINKFRAYSKSAASGGFETSGAAGTPSGGGSTTGYKGSASGGGSTTGITGGNITTGNERVWVEGNPADVSLYRTYAYPGIAGSYRGNTLYAVNQARQMLHTHYMGNHTHTTPNHTHPNHQHSTPNHTHPNHTHTVPNHVHGLVYGIYEESQSPKINVYVSNDGINYGDSIGEYEEDYLNIDITGISGPGWKRIKFTSDVRARVSAIIICKIDLSA